MIRKANELVVVFLIKNEYLSSDLQQLFVAFEVSELTALWRNGLDGAHGMMHRNVSNLVRAELVKIHLRMLSEPQTRSMPLPVEASLPPRYATR